MPTPAFDPEVQVSYDGPLTDAFVKRARAAKDAKRLSFRELAHEWGISPAWAERILARDPQRRQDGKPSTATATRFKAIVESWEASLGRRLGESIKTSGADAAYHVGALNALGFEVSLRPLAK